MENNKKVIDYYWDDYDPNDFDPAKRPTSIMQDKVAPNSSKRNIVNNVETSDDYQTYSYNNKFNFKQNSTQNDLFANDDELDYSQFQPTKVVEINQSTELTDLDDLNLSNQNRFVPIDENDAIKPMSDVNQIYDRWQKSKINLITRKLDVLWSRVQEPRIEGRREYSFYALESLEELLNKPAEVVLDATPPVGGDEIYPDHKYFNNPDLLLKVRGKEDNTLSSVNDFITNKISENIIPNNYEIMTISGEQLSAQPLTTRTNILKNAKINIASSKKEAIFIDDNTFLDPDNLNYEQRLRLLKLAADPNNEKWKKLLQMKLNNGNLFSLPSIVKEQLQKIQTGEIELVEEATKDNEQY